MGKQRNYSVNWSDVDRHLLFQQIIRKQNYKCVKCKVKQHAKAIKKEDGSYQEVDEFQENFYRQIGVKILKIYLRLVQFTNFEDNPDFTSAYVMCPKCAQEQINKREKIKRPATETEFEGISIHLIRGLKNFCENEFGKRITTRQVVNLVKTYNFLKNDVNNK